jgi:hypothetical protein
VQHQPALGDRVIETGLIFRWRALELEQKRPVDLLGIDPAVLDGFEWRVRPACVLRLQDRRRGVARRTSCGVHVRCINVACHIRNPNRRTTEAGRLAVRHLRR